MDLKMYILVNDEVKMGKGKLAGQVGHAVASYFNKFIIGLQNEVTELEFENMTIGNSWSSGSDKHYSISELQKLNEYMKDAQKKIILKCPKSILEDLESARYVAIRDKGLTQLEPNTLTCVNIGIFSEENVPNWVKELKLV